MLVPPDGMERIVPQGLRPIVGMASIMTEVGSSLLLLVVVLLFCWCYYYDQSVLCVSNMRIRDLVVGKCKSVLLCAGY